MSEIILSIDIDIINIFSILSIILLICISTFQFLKDSYYIKENPQFESLIEKLSYLFYSYIFILQSGILYHVNYFHYSLSGSESDILYTEEPHPIISVIIILLFIISIFMTGISVIKNNQKKINITEYGNI